MKWFVILSLIAIGLALGLPPDPHAVSQLHASQAVYRLAMATLLIPYIIIWYAAFYAFAKLQDYSRPLKKTQDGAAFHNITIGMGIIAFSLVVPTIISLTLRSIAGNHPAFQPTSVIIINYVGIFPGLVGFLMIYNGSRLLVKTVRNKMENFDLRWNAPWFLLLSVVFSYLTLQNQYRYHPYHLSVWLLIVSFIVPYLYGWLVGLLAAYDLHIYAKTVSGLLYKQAVRQFATGITVTIMGSIAINFVNITIGQRLRHSLGSLLLADYVLLIIIIVGLVLMALGTKKLKSIEDI